jgi:hypothetical protein
VLDDLFFTKFCDGLVRRYLKTLASLGFGATILAVSFLIGALVIGPALSRIIPGNESPAIQSPKPSTGEIREQVLAL